MSKLVTIKPKPGSKKFLFRSDMGARNLHVVSEDGGKTQTEKVMSEFKGERFPKSRQFFRPKWSHSKRMWRLAGYEDLNTSNTKELMSLVRGCKFQYAKNHKKAGEYIEHADIYDFNDPFFNHKKLKVIANEGEVILDKDRPSDAIILAGLKRDPLFMVGGEDYNPLVSNRVKYIIVDKEIDLQYKKKKRDLKYEAYELFRALNDKKRRKIAYTLGLIKGEDISAELVEEVLSNYSEDTSKSPDENLSKQEYFIQTCKLTNSDLNTEYAVMKANKIGILKRTGGTWMLFGNPIGRNIKAVKEFLSQEENQELLVRMEEAIDDKSK